MRGLPLRSIWQIVSEINLAEIQREIETPFHLLIAADVEGDALDAAHHLTSDLADFVHPWITVTDSSGSGFLSHSTDIVPGANTRRTSSSQQDPPAPNFALLVTSRPDLSPDLSSLQQALNAQSIPSLVVVIGRESGRPESAIARRGEQARIAVPDWSTQNVSKVAARLVDHLPASLRLPFARRLPPLRPHALNLLIQETSQVNASYSFTTGLGETVPGLNFVLGAGDAIVLTKNQLMMAYKIALVSGKTGSPQQLLGEIVGVLGGGFLFRQLARQMSGLIPVWGIVPKVAVSYAGTWAIGRTVVVWATEGQKITPDLIRGHYREALGHGRQAAQRIVESAPRPRLPSAGPKQPPGKKAISSRLLRQVGKRIPRLPPRKS